MNRHEEIRKGLAWAEGQGLLRDWEASSPKGKRWWVQVYPAGTRTFTTAEVEAFIFGLRVAVRARASAVERRRSSEGGE